MRQKDSIESAATRRDRNERLLDVIRRGSEIDFCKFIECLDKTKQHHVSYILLNDWLATSITASISGSENVDDDLTRIIERLTDLLADTSHGPNVPLIDIVMRRLAELRKKQIELFYVKKGSILLFYFCKSLVALHCLHELVHQRAAQRNDAGNIPRLIEYSATWVVCILLRCNGALQTTQVVYGACVIMRRF